MKRHPKHLAVAAIAVGGCLALTACNSSAVASGGAGPAGQTRAAGGQGGPAGQGGTAGQGGPASQGRGFPGATGLVAAISGTTAQVQSATAQTAVSWTSTTTFTDQLSVSASALKVGACVSARPAFTGGGRGAGGASGTPAPTPTAVPTTIAAATVEITPAVKGSCAGGAIGSGFGGRGNRPTATGTRTPQGGDTNGSRFAGGQGGFARGATGTIAAVGSGTFQVTPAVRTGSTPATPMTVTYTGTTTFSQLETASASAVTVGSCVLAIGKADDTGAIAATSIAVSKPVGGTCTPGFRGGAGRAGATGGTANG